MASSSVLFVNGMFVLSFWRSNVTRFYSQNFFGKLGLEQCFCYSLTEYTLLVIPTVNLPVLPLSFGMHGCDRHYNCTYNFIANKCIGRFHTRGRKNRLAFDCVMWIYVVLLLTYKFVSMDKSLGKIVVSRLTNFRPFVRRKICLSRLLIRCTSDDLFVRDDLSVQTLCTSSSVKTAIDFQTN